uniref:Uncharacterized protein n=1 Tax=Rhizophagus irregularis (strain DAOM 181602 / DAOM 197198 / MUCL 43194) TaxID=747089 RepID=U9ULQ8_RHIID
MCVSDDKKLACISFITYEYGSKKREILEIYNMNNHQNIELDCHLGYDYYYFIFNLKEIKIFIDEEFEYDDNSKDESKQRRYIKENITVFSNEKFICTRIKDKIIIYSIELEIPIDSLDINNVIYQVVDFGIPSWKIVEKNV